MLAGLITTLAGCSTPKSSRVNLFERTDYLMTAPGDVVAGYTTHTNGVWFSRPAVERLQREQILP
jgi:hypothetical protein